MINSPDVFAKFNNMTAPSNSTGALYGSNFLQNNGNKIQTNPTQAGNVQQNPIETGAIKQTPVQTPTDAPKLPAQPASDEFVSSSKKEKMKKAAIIGAAIGVLSAVAVFAVKGIKTHALKKEISASYDTLCNSVAQTAQQVGVSFEKPQLVFENISSNVHAFYQPSTNKVIYNSSILSPKKRLIYTADSVGTEDIVSADKSKTIKLFDVFFSGKKSKSSRHLTKPEFMLDVNEVLTHELTHARQNQLALSSENALDTIAGLLQKQPELSKMSKDEILETMKKSHPFLFTYKPANVIKPSQRYVIKTPRGDSLGYGANDMLRAIYEYADPSKDRFAYYCNTAEIEARIAEAGFAKKALENPNIGVDKKILETNLKAKNMNIHNILKTFVTPKSKAA